MMLSPYTREKIENWVGDFCASDRLREAPPTTHEHAAAVLVEFMVAACSTREGRPGEIEPGDVEEADLKHALLNHVARLSLPAAAKAELPALGATFLAQLEEEGRLGGGRVLGAYVRALKQSYEEAASGKKQPLKRPGAKISRNDPCPCGSGKKYKTCCMRG